MFENLNNKGWGMELIHFWLSSVPHKFCQCSSDSKSKHSSSILEISVKIGIEVLLLSLFHLSLAARQHQVHWGRCQCLLTLPSPHPRTLTYSLCQVTFGLTKPLREETSSVPCAYHHENWLSL